MASLVSNNKCKIITCTNMAWPNNYGYCKLHNQVDNQVNVIETQSVSMR